MKNLADLHCHLGAAVSPRALWEIAHEQGMALPKNIKNYWDFMKSLKVTDDEPHQTYLDRFKPTHKIQSSPLAIERSVHHAASHAYTKNNVTTLELRMNPLLRTDNKKFDADMIILNACVSMKKVSNIYPINMGLILGVERSFTEHEAEIIIDKAIKFKSIGVVGVDVSGGSPKDFSEDKFVQPLLRAKKAGLGITFHTGEVTGSDEMCKIVEKIAPDRIGHGVKCIDNMDLMKELSKSNIILEICPTSNLRLGVLKDKKELWDTISVLLENNVPFCINTDGPAFLGISVNDELDLLRGLMTDKDIDELSDKAHDYCFEKLMEK